MKNQSKQNLSWHDWKIVDWDVKNPNKQTKSEYYHTIFIMPQISKK